MSLENSVARDLTAAEVRNARLPKEIWAVILEKTEYPFESLMLYRSIVEDAFLLPRKEKPFPIPFKDLSRDTQARIEIANIKRTSRALHRWVQEKQWRIVSITSMEELKALLSRAKSEPGALNLVRVFRIAPEWAWASEYAHDSEICGKVEEWYFAERRDHLIEYCDKHMIPPSAHYSQKMLEFLELHPWDDPKITGWNDGPDGSGEVAGLMDTVSVRDKLEQVLLQMHSLQVFHYGTQIIPMTEKMCRFLAQAEHLQVVSIAPSGEFFTLDQSLSPLWLIFEGREERPLHSMYLNVEVFPSSNEFTVARECWSGGVPVALNGLKGAYRDAKTPFALPNPTRYLKYKRSDDKDEPTLCFVERPLAMVYRTLMASRGKLRQLHTTEKALARVIDLIPLWSQPAFFAYDNDVRRTGWEKDEYVHAVQALQDGLRRLAQSRRPDEAACPSESELMNMLKTPTLSPLKSMLQGRRAKQEQLWNNFLKAQKASLPDWGHVHMQKQPSFESWVSMSNQPYVRGLPERQPSQAEWRSRISEMKNFSFSGFYAAMDMHERGDYDHDDYDEDEEYDEYDDYGGGGDGTYFDSESSEDEDEDGWVDEPDGEIY